MELKQFWEEIVVGNNFKKINLIFIFFIFVGGYEVLSKSFC